MTERALLIEDDRELCDVLVPELQGLGYTVDCAHDGLSGLEMGLAADYVALVLDIMLPKLDGVEVCRRLREKKPDVPILILSARSDETNKVLLLELGADDYLTKPFSITELKARIKAIVRRQAKAKHATRKDLRTIVCGELVVHLDAGIAELSNKPLPLTSAEFQIIVLLGSQIGRVFSRDEIVEAIHGTPLHGYDAAVTTHINRLRIKLERDPARPEYLHTVRGMGYRLVDPSSKRPVG